MAKEYLHIASFDRTFSDECNVEGYIQTNIQNSIIICNLELLGLVSFIDIVIMIFLTLITSSLKDFLDVSLIRIFE